MNLIKRIKFLALAAAIKVTKVVVIKRKILVKMMKALNQNV